MLKAPARFGRVALFEDRQIWCGAKYASDGKSIDIPVQRNSGRFRDFRFIQPVSVNEGGEAFSVEETGPAKVAGLCFVFAEVLNMNKYGAEFFGTFWLVLGGCGSAVLHAGEIGTLGVSLAFGLTVLTMAYAIGHISGCHLNPAVSLGLWAAGRFETKELAPYIVSQVIGGLAGAGVLYLIASGTAGFDLSAGFASTGYAEHSPGGYSLGAAAITEVVMTAFFLMIILGSTDRRAPAGLAPIAIGLGLTLIHLISIPVTNTSVNPARSLGVAVFVGDWALAQVWLFWVAPIVGALIGAVLYRNFIRRDEAVAG